MKKVIILFSLMLIVSAFLTSCRDSESVLEIEELYGVDKDKAKRPGNSG